MKNTGFLVGAAALAVVAAGGLTAGCQSNSCCKKGCVKAMTNKDFYKGIIFGEEGSTAEQYAKKFGYGFETTDQFYIRQQDLREQATRLVPEGAEIYAPEDLESDAGAEPDAEDTEELEESES